MASKKLRKCEIEGCSKKGKPQPCKAFCTISELGMQGCGSCRHRLAAKKKVGEAQQSSTSVAADAIESQGAASAGSSTYAQQLVTASSSSGELHFTENTGVF